jgi:DNA-binding transcriptional MerR regulator
MQVYCWRVHRDDVEPYWVRGQRAAEILGVNVTRLNQLASRGFLPYEVTAGGARLYRRHQLRAVAQAREARWARYH